MKNPKHARRGGSRRTSRSRNTTGDLLRLIQCQLMSPYGGAQTNFTRVNLEGSNVGSSMMIRRAAGKDSDGDRINVYVSNNIQGVNNSILVGSSVQMGDPGVQFSLGDEQLHLDKRANGPSILTGCSFFGFLICFAIAVLFLLFVVTGNETT